MESSGQGHKTETEAIVTIAVDIKHPKGFGRIRLKRVSDATAENLVPFIDEAVASGATVHTDWRPVYGKLPERGFDHERTVMRQQNDPAHVVMPGCTALRAYSAVGSPTFSGERSYRASVARSTRASSALNLDNPAALIARSLHRPSPQVRPPAPPTRLNTSMLSGRSPGSGPRSVARSRIPIDARGPSHTYKRPSGVRRSNNTATR